MAKNRYRSKKISIWLSDDELELFEKKISEIGISKSDYIRNCILYGSTIKKTNFSDDKADRIVYEMNRIGNNVNQIARYVNKEHEASQTDMIELQRLVNDLNCIIMDMVLE